MKKLEVGHIVNCGDGAQGRILEISKDEESFYVGGWMPKNKISFRYDGNIDMRAIKICEECDVALNDPMGLYLCREHGTMATWPPAILKNAVDEYIKTNMDKNDSKQ
jgi:hypothetical protein